MVDATSRYPDTSQMFAESVRTRRIVAAAAVVAGQELASESAQLVKVQSDCLEWRLKRLMRSS